MEKKKIFYGAVVDTMDMGVIMVEGGSICSALNLHYPSYITMNAILVAQEMDRQNLIPKVYLTKDPRSGKNYAIVLFNIKAVGPDLLRLLMPREKLEIVGAEPDLLMTAEAEFPFGETNPFMDCFRQKGYFLLNICGAVSGIPRETNSFWSTRLTSFQNHWPDLYAEID